MFKFEDNKLARSLLSELKKMNLNIRLMHACGTHQDTLIKAGLNSVFLDLGIEIRQGPGCPICVTPTEEIEEAVVFAENGFTVTAFGDAMRVRGYKRSLFDARGLGADVRIVYSISDAVELARKHKDKKVVFLALGFETTAPMTAAAISSEPPQNFSVLSAHRLTVPAMELLLKAENRKTQGFICPGHVSVIIGTKAYIPFSKKYFMPCVITGFEAIDMLVALIQIINMINDKQPKVINEYTRVVKPEGNLKAKALLEQVFTIKDANWRGIGLVPQSGLAISKKFEQYDAFKKFDVEIEETIDIHLNCKCHEIMLGNLLPPQCPLFMRKCTPDYPIGPCMVSHEGTCSIFARYGSSYLDSG